jgi:hypothetical protein
MTAKNYLPQGRLLVYIFYLVFSLSNLRQPGNFPIHYVKDR